MASVD